ncbi:MAG: nitroreductase [Burkholderiales bacterium]|nr:nitroreductase [Burkholderiales bacterium]
MNAIEALHTRESAAKLQEPAPDEVALEAILKAAVRAPDHGRLRPWRFIAIRGEALRRFGEVLAEALQARSPAIAPDMLARERAKALRAPLVVVVAARIQRDGKIPEIEQILSAGAAAQNIMLAAHALAYGAMWKTGDPAYDPHVKRALGLHEDDAIVAFIYLGTNSGGPRPSATRPEIHDVLTEWRG